MKIFVLSAFIATFLYMNMLYSQTSQEVSNYKFRYVQNEAFGFGEVLQYKVGYKFITAGYGGFKIMPDPVNKFGRNCYDIRFDVKSLKSLEFLYKIHNQFRSVVDVGGLFSWQHEERVREGRYKRDFQVHFDQVNNRAFVPKKDTSYPTSEYVHDIISAFYYVRTLDLNRMKRDSVFFLDNFVKDTVYKLGVRVVGKETVKVEAGTFRCIIIEPLLVDGGLFKNEGRISIWLTDDARKIPVKVASRILIGSVEVELIKYSGIRGPVNARIQ